MEDPYDNLGNVYTGPGFRLPFYIVSPWTRGGHVYVEHADHNSQIKFVEQWLAAKGYNATTDQMVPWRREHMSDLVRAFDFNNPDYSIPNLPVAETAHTNSEGDWDGYAVCEATYADPRPPVPYGKQNASIALFSEEGFKSVRGQLTEGRYLVFEMDGYALTGANGTLAASSATAQHESKNQRWVLHQVTAGGNTFTLSNVIGGFNKTVTIDDLGNGNGHTVRSDGTYVAIDAAGQIISGTRSSGFKVFSVTYSD